MGRAGRDEPVTQLRGASVAVDPRRVGLAVTSLLLLSFLGLVAALFVAGASKNDQINRLRGSGVPVDISVTACQGLLGGSGSNAAGYACRGSYSLGGRRFNEAIPGNTLYNPGTNLAGVAVPGDPSLVVPDRILDAEHASNRVFVVPSVLLLLLAALGGLVRWWRLRSRAGAALRSSVAGAYRLRDVAGGV